MTTCLLSKHKKSTQSLWDVNLNVNLNWVTPNMGVESIKSINKA